MAMSNALTVLLLSLIIYTQGLEQQPSLGSRSKRDTSASSMFSTFTNLEKRLAAVEATAQCDNSTEERLVQLEAEMTKLQEKMSVLDKRLEDIDLNAVSLHNASMLAIHGAVLPVMDLVAALERSFKSTMRSATEIMVSMMSSLETRLLAKAENNAAMFNASIVRVEQTIKELVTRMSALEKDTERMAALEQVVFSMQNATEIMAAMMNDTKDQLLARAKDNAATFNASITRVEQSTKELTTNMSAVRNKLDNTTLLHAEEMEKTWVMMTDLKKTTKDRCGPPQYRRTCKDYYNNGERSSGTYSLLLEDGQEPMEVYCDMTNGPGWVVFQRREDGSVDFYRNWKSYEEGFGDREGEFWLGNRNIHRLTRAGLTQLRVDLQAWNGSSSFASYSNFSVGDARSSYKLSVSGYDNSSTAGDSLGSNNGYKFTTFDRDEDTWSDGNCAQEFKGAWWHWVCTNSNLNGQYGTKGSNGDQYVTWYYWLGTQSLQRTELKLK